VTGNASLLMGLGNNTMLLGSAVGTNPVNLLIVDKQASLTVFGSTDSVTIDGLTATDVDALMLGRLDSLSVDTLNVPGVALFVGTPNANASFDPTTFTGGGHRVPLRIRHLGHERRAGTDVREEVRRSHRLDAPSRITSDVMRARQPPEARRLFSLLIFAWRMTRQGQPRLPIIRPPGSVHSLCKRQ
jgi:hypothetical protein